MDNRHYEVLIIGGGISGAALSYELARYTDVKRIAIVEKYEDIGTLNTFGTSNSQTIHVGDIETNYTLPKAAITKRTAKMVEKYCLQHQLENKVIFSHQKMALGVGSREVKFMLERYDEFSQLFPYLQVWNKEKLKEVEPKVVFDDKGNERHEPIVGIGAQNEWTTVDYGLMAKSLVENAQKEPGKTVDSFLNSPVTKIRKIKDGGYSIYTPDQSFSADFVVVDAGAHSLYLAHRLGFGLDYGCLPMAGSFYMSTQKLLNGKVYMVQNPKLPFAALHGDPDILADGFTRFGPTALMLPKLERYKPGTYLDFWKTLRFDGDIASIFYDLLKDSDIRSYVFKNFLFEVPGLNKKLFIQDARKIVPSLKPEDIRYAKGFGGVRPQVLNKKERRLMLGEASINPGNGILFNMTPSPGATSCLGNAERDITIIMEHLGRTFDAERFNEELIDPTCALAYETIKEQKSYASEIRDEIYAYEEEMFSCLNDAQIPPSDWEEEYSPWSTHRYHWSM